VKEGSDHSTTNNRIELIEQTKVRDLFNDSSTFWTKIYQRNDLFAIIHQKRQAIALKYVAELSLPKTSRVLEIGCGSGFMTIALAKRGYTIKTLDCSRAMIRVAQNNANRAGLEKRIQMNIGDVHNLGFQNRSFDLIVALGVTPWLYDLKKALNEIARILTPGGYAVLNGDNIFRLNELFDPWRSPSVVSGREWVKKQLKRGSQNSRIVAHPHKYSIQKFNKYLYESKLKNLKSTNLGFGPFLLFSQIKLADGIGVKVNQKLQQYSDNGFPILRSTGSQYIVLAKKV
jgi:ubiquinone/menaquinone biosynthesis C-methylase UbiE